MYFLLWILLSYFVYLICNVIVARDIIGINPYILVSLWIMVNLLDIHSTYSLLRNARGEEANPFAAWLFEKIGFIKTILLLKIPIVALMAYLVLKIPSARVMILALSVILTFVVLNNYICYIMDIVEERTSQKSTSQEGYHDNP